MLTKAFWKATAERSVRTFAQVLVGSLGLDTLGIIHANWSEGLALGGGAAVLTVLTAVATSGGTEGPGVTETVRSRE
ncbi:holin [Streptomyces sp. NPDC058335]|uniref:holin n=1 Tax=Streptomyces sp. NPDC058335 TaxID=3346451 RepID=UPI003647447A